VVERVGRLVNLLNTVLCLPLYSLWFRKGVPDVRSSIKKFFFSSSGFSSSGAFIFAWSPAVEASQDLLVFPGRNIEGKYEYNTAEGTFIVLPCSHPSSPSVPYIHPCTPRAAFSLFTVQVRIYWKLWTCWTDQRHPLPNAVNYAGRTSVLAPLRALRLSKHVQALVLNP